MLGHCDAEPAALAALALENLARGSDVRKSKINALNAVGYLVPLLRHSSPRLEEQAAGALRALEPTFFGAD